jgi:hypothetical protein
MSSDIIFFHCIHLTLCWGVEKKSSLRVIWLDTLEYLFDEAEICEAAFHRRLELTCGFRIQSVEGNYAES